jgi:hypothetical protein
MLRRPPTAISLRPSDVTDLAASLVAPSTNATEGGKGAGQAEVVGQAGRDELVERERREREEREARGVAGRLGI